MNNIKFPEMDSNTSSDAGGEILNTLNTKLNNFKPPVIEKLASFASALPSLSQQPTNTSNITYAVQQSNAAPTTQPSNTSNVTHIAHIAHSHTATPRPPPVASKVATQSTSVSQPQSKNVSFDHNVQHKTISPNPTKSDNNSITKPSDETKLETKLETKSAEGEKVLSPSNDVKKERFIDKFLPNLSSKLPAEFINIGSVKMPTKTLILIVGVIGVSVALFFATRDKNKNKNKNKKSKNDKKKGKDDEDEDDEDDE
jgi:hypothetical protein